MIKSFLHKGLQLYFETGNKKGIQPYHASKLSRQLIRLDQAKSPEDMNVPVWRLHELEGKLKNHYSVCVSGNWRMTFKFDVTQFWWIIKIIIKGYKYVANV